MESKSNGSSGGVGFVGLLTIVFIVLKLIGVIAWSWWWVLSPVLITCGIIIVAMLIAWGVYLAKK